MTLDELTVARLRASHRGDWLVVQLRTADGRTGLGEASQSGDDDLTTRLLRDTLGPALRGRDPRRVHRLVAELSPAVGDGLPGRTALSAVEQACWDLVGQSLGVPIHALWGGALRDRVFCYANVNRSPLEFPWGEVPWRGDLIHPPERVEGSLAVPSGPGLGVTLHPATAEHGEVWQRWMPR